MVRIYKIIYLILGFVLVRVYYDGVLSETRVTRPYSKYLNEIGTRIKYSIDTRKKAYCFEFPNRKITIYMLAGD